MGVLTLSMKKLFQIYRRIILLLSLGVFAHVGHATEAVITARVIKHSELAQKIEQACQDYCQGNQRHGKLQRVTIRPLGKGRYAVRAWGDLRNYEVLDTVSGEFTLYDYTVRAEARATLVAASCALTIDEILIHDDPFGLDRLTEQLRGQVYKVPNCKQYID